MRKAESEPVIMGQAGTQDQAGQTGRQILQISSLLPS